MARRFPARIGNWKVEEGSHSVEGLLAVLREAVCEALREIERPGLLLSGGVDSSLLALLAKEQCPNIPCFTVGTGPEHPDVAAAARIASEKDLALYLHQPSGAEVEWARVRTASRSLGDAGVLIALEFAARFVSGLLAGDGIDEQMGGYWWHANESDRFPSREAAFEHFWGELESAHLKPMFRSAKQVDLDIHWTFLVPPVVDYIAGIPLADRVADGVGKAFLRETARLAGVPEWVIQRPKRGFVDALNKVDHGESDQDARREERQCEVASGG